MQDIKNTVKKTTPTNKVLKGIKYSLAFAIAFNYNVKLANSVTINTDRVLP